LVIGATEQGLFSRLVSGSLVLDVLDDVACSVVLAETRSERGLFDRLFGSGARSRTPIEPDDAATDASAAPEVSTESPDTGDTTD
jgi:hypothetical protein